MSDTSQQRTGEATAGDPPGVDVTHLREEVRHHYAQVAVAPSDEYHFHTGRRAALQVGYESELLEGVPEQALEAFAGIANPFHFGLPAAGEKVVDIGSGAGTDAMIAARAVGDGGRVIGVDMTSEMLELARGTAAEEGISNVEFRQGLAEKLPIEDDWADLVISNGVLNLVPDKVGAYNEVMRVLRPGGRIQIADICVDKPVPESAKRDIDLWTGWIAGGLPCAGWQVILEGVGLLDVEFGPEVDTYAGASGEGNARRFGTFGYPFRGRKP